MRICAVSIVALGLAAAHALPASAQNDPRWRVRQFIVENDDVFPIFYNEPTDRFYTQGARAVFGKRQFGPNDEPSELPAWARIAARRCRACSIYPTFSFGQELYTPEKIEFPGPQPGEHPWAAWLYGAVGATVDTPKGGHHVYQLQVGTTGSRAGGRQLQEAWHGVIGSPRAQGWGNQLGPDVGVNAYYSFEKVRFASHAGSRIHWDFAPSVDAAVGTMRTHAAVGGRIRIGRSIRGFLYSIEDDPIERPLRPVRFRQANIYGFVGAKVRVVGFNYFLEGSRFHNDPNTVEPRKIVREFNFGIAARYKGWEMTYTVTHLSEQFIRLVGNDSGVHSYGSLMFTRGLR